jgi:hypothetical protein
MANAEHPNSKNEIWITIQSTAQMPNIDRGLMSTARLIKKEKLHHSNSRFPLQSFCIVRTRHSSKEKSRSQIITMGTLSFFSSFCWLTEKKTFKLFGTIWTEENLSCEIWTDTIRFWGWCWHRTGSCMMQSSRRLDSYLSINGSKREDNQTSPPLSLM